jgi:hypothetical protein
MAAEIECKSGNLIVVKETVVAGVSNNAEMLIPVSLAPYAMLAGRELKEVITTPGTGGLTPATWIGTIKDTLDRTLVTVASRSPLSTETLKGDVTLGHYPNFWSDWTMAFTGIGNGKQVTARLLFK